MGSGFNVFSSGVDLVAGEKRRSSDKKRARYTRYAKGVQERQMRRNALASVAQSTRAAREARRQGDIMESDARAAMAAGGGTTTSASAVDTIGDIRQHTDYRVLAELFEGKLKQREYEEAIEIDQYLARADSVTDLSDDFSRITSVISAVSGSGAFGSFGS